MLINFKEAILFVQFYNGLSNRCSFSGTIGQRSALSFFEYHHKRWQNTRVHPCKWNVIWELGEQIL